MMNDQTKITDDPIRAIDALHVTDDVYLRIQTSFNRHLDAVANGAKESRAFVIAAESGAGKTHTIANLIAAKRFDPTADEMGKQRPLVAVTAPAPCTLKALGFEIYEKMTSDALPPRTTEHEIWRRIRNTARILGVQVLVIDEMHHLFDAKNEKDVMAVLATLKRLIVGEIDDGRQTHVSFRPITLILSGMPALESVLARDHQIKRRCIFEKITPDGADADSKRKQSKFLSLFNERLSKIMGKPQEIETPDMTARLVAASNSYRGRMCVLLKQAAAFAVLDGSRKIDRVRHLAVVFRETYDANDADNPFLMEDPRKFKPIQPAEREIPTKLRGTRKRNP